MAIPLLDAGLHVMVEKPAGITIRATRTIIRAAERNNRILATAEQVRRGVKARACRWALIEKKLIGEVQRVVVQSIDNAGRDFTRPLFKWRGLKLLGGGGMIMDSGAHFTDMMLHLFGEVDRVFCSMSTQRPTLIEDAPFLGTQLCDVEDTWHAFIRFANGVETLWTYSQTAPGTSLRDAVYYGTNGTMRDLGFPFHCFQGGADALLADGTTISADDIVADYLAELSPAEKARLFPYENPFDMAVEIWDFARAVRTGGTPEIDGEAGLRAKALCEACFESATLDRPVAYRDVLEGKIRTFQQPIDEYWNL